MPMNNRAAIRLDALGLFLAGFTNTILALLVAVFIHGPGTLSSQPDLLSRASWIAENRTLWKVGWLFWFAPTLSFAWSYYALGRNLAGKPQWRNLAIGVGIIAAAVDVVGMLVNLTVLPELAHEIVATAPNLDPTLQVIFLSMEKLANTLTNIGGYGLYTLAGVLILPSIFATQDCPRWLGWLGVGEWGVSVVAVGLLIVAPTVAGIPLVVSFLFYAPWVWGAAWWLLHRAPARV